MIEKDVKMTSMKNLPKTQISDELDAQIDECIKVSELSKADVVRQALRIGLAQIAAKFRPPPLWLEDRVREPLAEPAEPVSAARFAKNMKAVVRGR